MGTLPTHKYVKNRMEDIKEHASDVIKTNDVIPKPKKVPENQQEQYEALPLVVTVHDSVMKDIQTRRLGRSYGFDGVSGKAEEPEEIKKTLDMIVAKNNRPIDCFLLHCGVEELSKKDLPSASKHFASCVKQIAREYPTSKIVISKITPARNPKMEIQRNLYNALLAAELVNVNNISYISHENLRTNKQYMKDDIHPTRRGTSVIAGNVGRHIRDLFWETPRRKTRPRSSFRNSSKDLLSLPPGQLDYFRYQGSWRLPYSCY